MSKFLGQRIHQSYFVVAFCIGIIIGVIIALIFRFNFFSSSLWIILILFLLVFTYFLPKRWLLILVFFAGVILSLFRFSFELFSEEYISQFYGKTVLISGAINWEPETDEKGTKIKISDLSFGKEKYKTGGSIFITLKENESIWRSDRITVSGKLMEGFGTYLGYMYKPKVLNISRPEPGDVTLKIRNWFAERVSQLIPEPEVNLGLSYLLGMKGGLSDELSEKLRTVGLVHIVVASGTHLSILVGIAGKIFGKISRFSGLLFSMLFVLFFMAMVGFTPSILRAGIMSILTVLVGYTGRRFAPWRIILLVSAGTLIYEPMYIINLGWLLSFSAFSGIMILGPKLTEFFYGEKKPGFISSTIITTISATILTLPITLYFYGSVSLISILANLLILPTLPVAMGLVFLSGIIMGFLVLETVVSFLATKILDYHIMIVDFFSSMKSFLVTMETEQAWVFLIYVFIIGVFVLSWIIRVFSEFKKNE